MKSKLTIVAFGDSLTVGYQSPSSGNPFGEITPYGAYLQKLLGESGKVIINGNSGELTGEMTGRLTADVISFHPDFVIILGGSNDLGWGGHPDAVMRNLLAMYERARSSNIQPIAVTVPSIRGFDVLIPPRQVLNSMIIEYCRRQSQPCIDLFTATAEPDTLRLAEVYSNDGLHLTTEGYRLFAQLLYDQIFNSIVNN